MQCHTIYSLSFMGLQKKWIIALFYAFMKTFSNIFHTIFAVVYITPTRKGFCRCDVVDDTCESDKLHQRFI